MSSRHSLFRMPTPEEQVLLGRMLEEAARKLPRNYKPTPHPLAVAIHVIGLTK